MKKLAFAICCMSLVALAQNIIETTPESSVIATEVQLHLLPDGGCVFYGFGQSTLTDGGIVRGATGPVQLANAPQRTRCLTILNDVRTYYLNKKKGQ